MKILNKLSGLVLMMSVMFIASCASGEKKCDATVASAGEGSCEQMVIRYINEDTLTAKYNLVKDLNEAMLRSTNQYDSEQQRRAREIQKFATDMENKYRNNGYLSQESFNADQSKLQKMNSDAEAYLAQMQRKIQEEMMRNQSQLNDSVDNYLKEFCKANGYEVVLKKAAAFYIDSKYDVTDAVVEGLNKRYNKVEKK